MHASLVIYDYDLIILAQAKEAAGSAYLLGPGKRFFITLTLHGCLMVM